MSNELAAVCAEKYLESRPPESRVPRGFRWSFVSKFPYEIWRATPDSFIPATFRYFTLSKLWTPIEDNSCDTA